MTTLSERVTVLETSAPLQHKILEDKIDNIEDFLRNGFTLKVQQTIREELNKSSGKKKSELLWIWINRVTNMIFWLAAVAVSSWVGIDLTGSNSIIMRLLSGSP